MFCFELHGNTLTEFSIDILDLCWCYWEVKNCPFHQYAFLILPSSTNCRVCCILWFRAKEATNSILKIIQLKFIWNPNLLYMSIVLVWWGILPKLETALNLHPHWNTSYLSHPLFPVLCPLCWHWQWYLCMDGRINRNVVLLLYLFLFFGLWVE